MNEMEKLLQAIKNINPDAIYSIREITDVTLDGVEINWLEGTAPISKDNLKEEMDKL